MSQSVLGVSMILQPIDYLVLTRLALALASTAYVAWDQFRGNPEPAVVKWGFVLTTLYMGPIGALMYVLATSLKAFETTSGSS